jgi:protein-disulfide isomerase/uncharacterized membrane protein
VLALVALHEYVVFSRGLATGPSFCNISQKVNCEVVNASAWSSFFGLPVAAYGIFFYVSLLGLLLMTGPGRAVSAPVVSRVTLVCACIATIVSVGLFAISKFIIGAYCLLCLGLYAINCLLLWFSWVEHRRSGFFRGLTEGVSSIVSFIGQAITGKPAQLRGAIALIVVGVVSALSPQIVYGIVSGLAASPASQMQPDAGNLFKQWQDSPVASFPVFEETGALRDYAKGEPGAPIQIVEFADFECPGCRMTYAGLDSLLKEYEGRYRLVFKNYPLDSACNPGIQGAMHTMACFTAYFTRCAGEQGKFWEALDFVFTDPVLEEVEDTPARKSELLERGSKTLGLDQQAIEECVNSERYLKKIQSDVKEANQLGLQVTPSFWVNGKRVPRPTHAVFSAIFKSIVAGAKGSVQVSR